MTLKLMAENLSALIGILSKNAEERELERDNLLEERDNLLEELNDSLVYFEGWNQFLSLMPNHQSEAEGYSQISHEIEALPLGPLAYGMLQYPGGNSSFSWSMNPSDKAYCKAARRTSLKDFSADDARLLGESMVGPYAEKFKKESSSLYLSWGFHFFPTVVDPAAATTVNISMYALPPSGMAFSDLKLMLENLFTEIGKEWGTGDPVYVGRLTQRIFNETPIITNRFLLPSNDLTARDGVVPRLGSITLREFS